MRLPADGTLIVAGDASEEAAANVASLLAAWRAHALPIVHIDHNGSAPGEVTLASLDATALEQALDAIGATTLVLCGEAGAVVAAAGTAGDIGCHLFVATDACSGVLTLARGDDVRLVDTSRAVAAAAVAKLRQRREAARRQSFIAGGTLMSERPKAQPIVHIDEPHVRVTEWRFAPGAETGWHIHEADYVVVPLADGELLLEEPGGKSRTARLGRHAPYQRRAGVEHNVVNANPYDFAFMEIEHLKRGSGEA